ncbi:RNA polymerase sigma factor [Sphingobacterium griseoflavum]|uniref:DNA-directed RNA polymerase sigma-70 factor n=1 Tax=Sphingobacterium griseoflavum TaxID=1474952 RepID=A0ABQ3HYQ5_9SPHI|nr:sigma-70 family RNA polymerase sigma factor [Sphingobacterium griseoflavum]GHE37580.1 DNA-directed RNA polymerase sigma-70 factor [Sphingobacterium griseoflavum]
MNDLDPDKLLFGKYYRSLCYFAWQMVQDENLAEDLAQDAFVSYFQERDRIASDEKAIKAFLYTAIKYAVYNLSRKSKTVKKFWQRTGYQERDDIDYEHQVIRAEFMTAIHATLSTLPDGCQKIMTMSYVDGFSNEEIAEQLKISINTIKTQKKRGLRVLRSKLSSDYFSIVFTLFLSNF